MSEAGWLAIATPLLAAIIAGVGFIVKALLASKDGVIAKQEDEIKALRAKVDLLQTEVLTGARNALDTALKRAETDQRVARSIEDQTALIAKLHAQLAAKPTP